MQAGLQATLQHTHRAHTRCGAPPLPGRDRRVRVRSSTSWTGRGLWPSVRVLLVSGVSPDTAPTQPPSSSPPALPGQSQRLRCLAHEAHSRLVQQRGRHRRHQ